jgi:hypothetical protein
MLPFSVILAVTAMATADTFTVDDDAPADFSTIQDAVDAATDGDVWRTMPQPT